MLFNSFAFALFFPVAFALRWAAERFGGVRARNAVLLAASYYFYGCWDWRFLGLIIGSSVVDFVAAQAMSRPDATPATRKLWCGVSLVANLGALGVFKYLGFFVEQARAILGALGFATDGPALDLLLPVGISFYTFQTLSYTLDVYRGLIRPTRDPLAFLTYVAFFPQLVAGPIERAEDLLPQFEAPRPFDEGKARDGARQMLWGLVKKVLIADNLAPVVEAIFHRPDAVDGPTALLGAGLFFVQIYGDFSGYSDIAIGSARLLGFDLSQNFALPFFSRDCTEFWRRWHITLNTWLRDYVFLTLEMGTRRRHLARRRALPPDRPGPRTPPAWRSAANLLLVFTLSGLWHGAAWTFVFWGFLNGLFLVPAALRRTAGATGPIAPGRWLPSLGELRGMVTTNLLIGLSLIFFRADSMGDAFAFFGALLTGPWLGFDLAPFVEPLALCGGLIVVEWLRRDRPHPLAGDDWSVGLRWATYCALILALIVRGSLASREFVYFQF